MIESPKTVRAEKTSNARNVAKARATQTARNGNVLQDYKIYEKKEWERAK